MGFRVMWRVLTLARLVLALLIVAGRPALSQQQPSAFADLIPDSEAKPLPVAKKPSGPYQIEPQANSGNVWVLDTVTGALRLCLPPAQKVPGTPECYAWGDATK